MDQLRSRYQQSNFSVLGLDMYNGNTSQLSLFQASTSVSFPLLQKAVNGTNYGAWRDEMMLIDQTGTQRVLVDIRRDPNWQSTMIEEIDRLIRIPVGRFASAPLNVSDIRVGETVTRTLQVVNDGRFGLTLSGPTSDVPGLSIDLGSRTLAPGDTANVSVTYMPGTPGHVSGTITIGTPGALRESIMLDFDAAVLPPLVARVVSPTAAIDLGSVEVDRSGTYAFTLTNEGTGDLVVSVSDASQKIRGLEEIRIAPGKSGSIRYTVDVDAEGPFATDLILATNDPDSPVLKVPITATGIVVPPEPRTDFDQNGVVDFADFLFFAAAFGTPEPLADFNGNGTVDFDDFLMFAQSFGKPVN